MTPEISIGMKVSDTLKTHESILEGCEKKYKAFLEAYKDIEENFPECEEIIEKLKKRLEYAHELCIDRHTKRPSAGIGSHDESYYEWIDEIHAKEEARLDGDFPLGCQEDAEFANNFFTVEELAYIQCGLHHMIITGKYNGYNSDVLVRRGFVAELYSEWDMAVRAYEGVSTSKLVQDREYMCRKKMYEEGKACYEKVQEYMQSGQWSEISTPLYRAADMEYPDAMVDLALALIYGQYGMRTCVGEALELLRRASYMDCERACFELVELHDNGFVQVEGDEALDMCEKAARLGNKRAEERLKRGFDTRPVTEILAERAENGDVYSTWTLVQIYRTKKDYESAGTWFNRALEAGYPEALVEAAEAYLNKDSEYYNKQLAKQYLRRAADTGHIRAIIALGELELEDTDKHFWQTAMLLNKEGKPKRKICEQHSREFGWYKLAAEAGDSDAMNGMCVAYHFGYPVERDDTQAAAWAERAVELGNTPAMYQLAYLCENGFGTEKNIDRAVELYKESAESGIVSSMIRLYEIYKDGLEHIQPDETISRKYLWMSGYGHS